MLRIPLESLGISNADAMEFQFKWVDSVTVIDSVEKMYTDGDSAPIGRLNYLFRNF
jgi:hypothetical protein